jgi:hypothetical protein
LSPAHSLWQLCHTVVVVVMVGVCTGKQQKRGFRGSATASSPLIILRVIFEKVV